jgi:hypothetical protein
VNGGSGRNFDGFASITAEEAASALEVTQNVAFAEEVGVPLLPAADADFDLAIGALVQNESVLVCCHGLPFGRTMNVRRRGVESCFHARNGVRPLVGIMSSPQVLQQNYADASVRVHR